MVFQGGAKSEYRKGPVQSIEITRLPGIIERANGQPTAGRQRYILGAIQGELQQQQPQIAATPILDIEAEAKKCWQEKKTAKTICPIRQHQEAGGRPRCEIRLRPEKSILGHSGGVCPGGAEALERDFTIGNSWTDPGDLSSYAVWRPGSGVMSTWAAKLRFHPVSRTTAKHCARILFTEKLGSLLYCT